MVFSINILTLSEVIIILYHDVRIGGKALPDTILRCHNTKGCGFFVGSYQINQRGFLCVKEKGF